MSFRMIGLSPTTLAETINNNGRGISNCPPTPTNSTSQPSLVLTPSLSRQLSSAGKWSGPSYTDNKTPHKVLQQRLELAFWRQHEQLFQISRFFLDQLEQGLKLQLKEVRVAEAIHAAWGASTTVSQNTLSEHNTRRAEIPISEESAEDFAAKYKLLFKNRLHVEIKHIHRDTMHAVARHVETTAKNFFQNIFPQLLRLNPASERVIALALHLIRGQVDAETRHLVGYVDSLCMRKLDEVARFSCLQFGRSLIQLPAVSTQIATAGRPSGRGKEEFSQCMIGPLIRIRQVAPIEKLIYLQKHRAFAQMITDINGLIFCYISTPDSAEHADIQLTTWGDFSGNSYHCALKDTTKADLKSLSSSVVKDRNAAARICTLICDLITSTCEVLVLECAFSEDFFREVYRLVRYETYDSSGQSTADSGHTLIVFANIFSGIVIDRTEQASDDNNKKVLVVVKNMICMAMTLLEGLQILQTKFRDNEVAMVELAGSIHVEVMKCFSVAWPTLVHMDAFVFCASGGDMCFTAESAIKWPSSLMAVAARYVDNQAIARVIAGSAKSAQISYQETWRNCTGIKHIFTPFSLCFIIRYLKIGQSMYRPCEQKRSESATSDSVSFEDVTSFFSKDFVEQLKKLLSAYPSDTPPAIA